MTARLARIRRHPIKSVGGEDLQSVELAAGQRLPGDRRFGVLHAGAMAWQQDGVLSRWLPKAAMLRGVASPALAAVSGGWEGERLRLTHPDLPPLLFDPAGDDAPLLAWLAPLWPVDKPPAARLVEGPVPLTDVPDPFVSLLSLDSLRQLEADVAAPLDVERWRGNLWVEGWRPHHERDLQSMRVRIGAEVEVMVRDHIGRCAQTDADARTGRRQLDMVAALMRLYDRSDFGVYVEVLKGGTVAVGDAVEVL